MGSEGRSDGAAMADASNQIRSDHLTLHSISVNLSQPATGFHREGESSMNINISRDNEDAFAEALTVLGSSSGISPSLCNLELSFIEWDSAWLQQLGILLDRNRNVKQLMFKQNRFGQEGFSQLCEILRTNRTVKEIIFSESELGCHGVTLLASALKMNDSVEEVQIWEDSIGSRGAEELGKMIEVTSALKLLTVFDLSSITASPVIAAVLARNRATEVHLWSGEGGKINKVVEFVPGNCTLRIYKVGRSGSVRVAGAMGMNSTVKVLDMTGVRLRSEWAKEFRWVLEQNQTLKEVILSETCLKNKAVVYVAAGLFKNRTLESLQVDGNWFSGIGVEHLLCPVSRFSALQIQANVTLKSVTIGGPRSEIGRGGLRAILQMLSTNQTITRFGIRHDRSLKPQDFIKMFNMLGTNSHLQHLSVRGCRGVVGESVAQAIMAALQVNPWIESIDISNTPLENSGLAEAIYRKMGQSGCNTHESDLVKDMPMSSPKSCRVFFCGEDHAGKKTLCNSISHHFSASSFSYSEHVKILVKPVEQVGKPVGLQIKSFKDSDVSISIWNLGGQNELYPLQELMFPGHGSGSGSASFFFIVSSLAQKPNNRRLKTPAQVEEDIHYWLRLVVSVSRAENQELMLPNVTIVLTHSDKISQTSNIMEAIADVVQRLRDKFQGFVDFYPTVFTIDARSHSSVSKLAHHLRATSKTILQRVPRVYDLCNEVLHMLSDWRGRNCNKAVMRWGDFAQLCQVKVPWLRVQTTGGGREMVEMRRKGVATCMSGLGEVMYFEELGLLILDCEWFCGEVLGQLVSLNVTKQESSSLKRNGFISQNELEKIVKKNLQSHIPGMSSRVLENMEASEVVSMMIKLNLCYLQDPTDVNSLLLTPSVMEDGRGRSQQWALTGPDCVYAGRHLECDDSSHMLLTPGFFPRLQVHLHNKIMGGGNQQGASYSVEKYLIVISINGVHIRVELCGQLGHSIDVLACSTKSLTETLKLMQQLIIPAIHSCCHSVPLTEHIIRPECVRNLTPPRHRTSQSVPVLKLKMALLSVPADGIYEYKHTWTEVWENGRLELRPGFDFARELVSEDDLREVLHRRYHDLYNLAMELQVPEEGPENSSSPAGEAEVDPTLGGIARGVEQVLQRLRIIEQEIRDVKQEIQGLRYYEQRVLLELNRKIEYLVNFSSQVEERKVPNMFYLVQTESYGRKLVMNMVPGMNAIRVHMLCEVRGEMHVVEDQTGCEVMQVDNRALQLLAPYMKKFMKLVTFALKIGAHMVAGMGEMIPDLSREVAHLSDSSLIYAAAGAAAGGAVGAAALGGRSRRVDGGRDIQEEQRTAQQWVIDFLRDHGCSSGRDIAEKFGLWRVRYRDDGRIAWICRRHMNSRGQEIVELPF